MKGLACSTREFVYTHKKPKSFDVVAKRASDGHFIKLPLAVVVKGIGC